MKQQYGGEDAAPAVNLSPKTIAYISELPGKIATFEAAAKVDANPPLTELQNWMGEVRAVKPGESVVYWMRMEDMRSTFLSVPSETNDRAARMF
jgi:deoxyribodipyrimidine photo-lyase